MIVECPECKRELEQNDVNFRFSCDGFWRKKCRDCQNNRKRMRYHNGKATQVEKLNVCNQARKQRLDAMIEKYNKIFKTLARLGISPDAPSSIVDRVLAGVPTLTRESA